MEKDAKFEKSFAHFLWRSAHHSADGASSSPPPPLSSPFSPQVAHHSPQRRFSFDIFFGIALFAD